MKLFVFLFAAAAFLSVGCKKVASDLRSNHKCDEDWISDLNRRIEVLESKDDESSLALGSTSSDALVASYSNGFKMDSRIFRKIVESAPYSGWELDLENGCRTYGKWKTDLQCKKSKDCKDFWGKDTAQLQQYFNRFSGDCKLNFRNHVNVKKALQQETQPNASGDNSAAQSNSDSEDSPDGKTTVGPKTSGNSGATPAQNAVELARLKKELQNCKDSSSSSNGEVSESEFSGRCEDAGGEFESRERPFACRCPSGKAIDFKTNKSCRTPDDARGLCSSIKEADWNPSNGVCVCKSNPQIRSANVWSIRNTLAAQCRQTAPAPNTSSSGAYSAPQKAPGSQDNPPSQPGPKEGSCVCQRNGSSCSKVVDGKVVASLTPHQNSVTGKQETCDGGMAGGYDNLCNQPQLKCP